MGRGAGGSVSCVSDVYSNTAQAGPHTAGSFHKHEWSPVVDRTHPAGGNLICNILSNSESWEEVGGPAETNSYGSRED